MAPPPLFETPDAEAPPPPTTLSSRLQGLPPDSNTQPSQNEGSNDSAGIGIATSSSIGNPFLQTCNEDNEPEKYGPIEREHYPNHHEDPILHCTLPLSLKKNNAGHSYVNMACTCYRYTVTSPLPGKPCGSIS